MTLEGRLEVDLGATVLEGRDLGAGVGAFGLGAAAFGAAAFGTGCERIWRISVSLTNSPC